MIASVPVAVGADLLASLALLLLVAGVLVLVGVGLGLYLWLGEPRFGAFI